MSSLSIKLQSAQIATSLNLTSLAGLFTIVKNLKMSEIMETRAITSEMNFLTRSDGSAILTQGKRQQ